MAVGGSDSLPPRSSSRISEPLFTLLFVAALAITVWFGLGMNRGLLLSSDVKGKVWPWAPTLPVSRLQAPALTDPVWQFVPWLQFARSELSAGRLPLWNPHQDGGVPLLGNHQSALLSPLVWPVLLLGVESGWNLSLLLRVLLAGCGALLWLREMGRSRAAAVLGALMFCMSGPFVAWLEAPNTLVVAAAPLLLLALDRNVRVASRASFTGLAVATALILVGGHPETAAMVALLALARLVVVAQGRSVALRSIGAATVGAMLAAPALLPFMGYLVNSEAARGVGRLVWVLSSGSLLRFLLPGAPAGLPIEAASTVSLVGLAFAALGAALALRRRQQRFWLCAAAAVLLVTYDNPVAVLLARHTPVYWTRALLLLPLALALLAALGFDAMREWVSRRYFRTAAALLVVLVPAAACFELLAAARGVHASTPARLVSARTPILARLGQDRSIFRILPLHEFLPANSATALGLDDVRGYDALAPTGWRRTRAAMGHFGDTRAIVDVVEPWQLAPGGAALDFWNVKYLLVEPRLPYGASRLNRELGLDLDEVYSGPDGRLLLNRRALPRVRFLGEGSCAVNEELPTRWRITVSASHTGELVVANPYFPGWHVQIDGRRVRERLRPGDPVVVPVPAGTHAVELFYLPASLLWGALLAGVGLALLAVVWRRSPSSATGWFRQRR